MLMQPASGVMHPCSFNVMALQAPAWQSMQAFSRRQDTTQSSAGRRLFDKRGSAEEGREHGVAQEQQRQVEWYSLKCTTDARSMTTAQ
jgi:hypothetical protein